jgi:hypothetical protein
LIESMGFWVFLIPGYAKIPQYSAKRHGFHYR